MVAAAIDPDNNLFITNTGDSRIYLCRDGQLIQLTRDHTFANVMVWLGKLTPEEAAVHPEASKVMRVLGIRDELQVDVGIYESTVDYGAANRIGREGYKLRPGDSVLLCSDGLVKRTPATDTELISPEGIARLLKTQEGERAARAIMSTVLGRIPVGEQVDNISLAVMQIEDPSRAANLAEVRRQEALREVRAQQRKMVLAGAVVGVPLALALIVTLAAFGAYYAYNRNGALGTATQLAEAATQLALVQAKTQPAPTASAAPSSTPRPTASLAPTQPPPQPTAVAGEVAEVFDGESTLGPILDDARQLIDVPVGETRYVAITYLRNQPTFPAVTSDGQVFLEGGSQVQIGLVTPNEFQLTLLPGTSLFVQSGPYPRGAEIHLANTTVEVLANGCLGLTYLDPGSVTLDCYAGECKYATQLGADFANITGQTQLTLAIGQSVPPPAVVIPFADHTRFWSLLNATQAGAASTARCQVPNAVATVAARVLSETQRAPTGTPVPSDTPADVGPAITDTPAP